MVTTILICGLVWVGEKQLLLVLLPAKLCQFQVVKTTLTRLELRDGKEINLKGDMMTHVSWSNHQLPDDEYQSKRLDWVASLEIDMQENTGYWLVGRLIVLLGLLLHICYWYMCQMCLVWAISVEKLTWSQEGNRKKRVVNLWLLAFIASRFTETMCSCFFLKHW